MSRNSDRSKLLNPDQTKPVGKIDEGVKQSESVLNAIWSWGANLFGPTGYDNLEQNPQAKDNEKEVRTKSTGYGTFGKNQ